MPNVSIALEEVEQSISRPIIYDIIRQIEDITKIDTKTKIIYTGSGISPTQAGSTVDAQSREALLSSNKIVFVEVDETEEIGAVATNATYHLDNIPVFHDPKIGVVMTPIYETVDVTISFRYQTTSKTEALKWRSDISIRASRGRDCNLHDITYHYAIPSPFYTLINTIYNYREATEGYGETFEEYMLSNSSERLTVIGDLANKTNKLAISEKQSRIVGQFGFDVLPEKPEFNNANGTWIVSFTYKFSYQRPSGCNILYPIIVHNQLLPPEYVTFNTSIKDENQINSKYTKSMLAMSYFEAQKQVDKRVNIRDTLILPEHDEFYTKQLLTGTGSVFFALCTFSETDHRTLLDLNDIDPVVIDRDIYQFLIESETPYITKHYQSILQLFVYKNKNMVEWDEYECTSQGVVKMKANQSRRNQYRVRFAVVTDITYLPKSAIDRLRKYPKAFVKLIGSINEKVANNAAIQKLTDRKIITPESFKQVYQLAVGLDPENPVSRKQYYRSKIQFNTLEIASIVAIKRPL